MSEKAKGDSFYLFKNVKNLAGNNGFAALADSKTKPLLHGNRMNKFPENFGIVAGHNHFFPFGKFNRTGNNGGPKIELGSVTGKEGPVTAVFFFGKTIYLARELEVRSDRTGLGKNLPPFHFSDNNGAPP
jgi:hypothetical protein